MSFFSGLQDMEIWYGTFLLQQIIWQSLPPLPHPLPPLLIRCCLAENFLRLLYSCPETVIMTISVATESSSLVEGLELCVWPCIHANKLNEGLEDTFTKFQLEQRSSHIAGDKVWMSEYTPQSTHTEYRHPVLWALKTSWAENPLFQDLPAQILP